MENILASKRLELAARGVSLPKEKDYPAPKVPRSRLDNWANLTTGFGTPSQHPTNNSQYSGIEKIDPDQLEELYRSDWVCGNGVDIPAVDMTRNGISYIHGDDDEKDTKKREDNKKNAQKLIEDFDDTLREGFNIWNYAFESIVGARVSGGSLAIFNFDDIDTPEEFRDPLNEKRINGIRWIRVLPAWFCIPVTFYRDINHPKFEQPEHYQVVMRSAGGGITLNVHESRCIRMDGKYTTQTPKATNRGWNDSEIQRVYTALRDYGICVTQSNSNMESFTQDYLGMKNLAEKVMMGDTDYVLERIWLAHSKMTSNTLSIYDADSETMERQGTPVTGLAELWDRYTEAICGAWRIPRSRFMSSESGALGGNAAESDTRNYFNRIKGEQEKQLRPWLNQFMTFVNYAVKMISDLPSYSFNELHEQSDKEKADTRYVQAQTDQIYIDAQVVSPEEVAVSRFSKDRPDLETMNIDWQAREEMKEEVSEEEIEEMRNTIADLEFEKAVGEASQQINTQPEQPEEKQDSKPVIIEHKPEIKVEAPQITVNIPEQKDPTESIKSVSDKLDKLQSKLDEDQEIVID